VADHDQIDIVLLGAWLDLVLDFPLGHLKPITFGTGRRSARCASMLFMPSRASIHFLVHHLEQCVVALVRWLAIAVVRTVVLGALVIAKLWVREALGI
jgi:hypothetical protein